MIAGDAPHLENFFLSYRFGRPKDVDQAPDRPPILFVSAYGPPGSYDPLARPAEPRGTAEMITHGPSLSLPAGIPTDLPHGATGPSRPAGTDPDPRDDGEEELVVVRG
jgi:hypothetical protein